MRCLGVEYFRLCLFEYGDSIRMIGSNMLEFFSNLDGLQTHISSSEKFRSQVPPSSRCEYEHDTMILHFYTDKRNLLEYYAGVVTGISKHLFQRDAVVTVSCSNTPGSLHHIFYIKADEANSKQIRTTYSPQEAISRSAVDSKIGTRTFCTTFPFHFIIDQKLDIVQIGEGLYKHVDLGKARRDRKLTLHFVIGRPRIEPLTFSALLSHVNFTFNLRTKNSSKHGNSQVSQ